MLYNVDGKMLKNAGNFIGLDVRNNDECERVEQGIEAIFISSPNPSKDLLPTSALAAIIPQIG